MPFLSYDLKLNTGRGETWDNSSWDIYLLLIKAIQGTHCHKEAKYSYNKLRLIQTRGRTNMKILALTLSEWIRQSKRL